MLDIASLKLKQALEECEKHMTRLQRAYQLLSSHIPFNSRSYQSLTEEQIEHLDQLIYRFSKFQDAMGNRLFPSVLLMLGEETKHKSAIDLLNRLEQLGIIPHAKTWLELRQLRNILSHEYSNDMETNVNTINLMLQNIATIVQLFNQIKQYLMERDKI